MDTSDVAIEFTPPTRVLLIDDDVAVHTEVGGLIRGAGHRRYVLKWVTTLVEGLWSVVAEEHDVYLVGHRLGDHTGLEFLSRAVDSRHRVPMIFLGDPDDYETYGTAIDAGASDYLVKGSIDSGLLNGTIRRAIEAEEAGSRLHEAQHEKVARNPRSGLLTTVNHHLRAPIETITATSDLALRGDLTEEARTHFARIQESARTLSTLANDLLDVSRIDAGILQLEPVRFGLRDLVTNSVRSLAPVARANGVTVRPDVASDVPDGVVGDPGRLRLALVKLAEMAIEHTKHGRIAIHVCNEMSSSRAVMLRFDVADADTVVASGNPGFIFAGGREKDQSISLRYDVDALRLEIVSKIVSRMGGRLSIGNGAQTEIVFRFTVCLGVFDAEGTAKVALPAETLEDLPLLIIADDLDNRRNLVRNLARSGFAPAVVPHPERAIAVLNAADAGGDLPRAVVIHSVDDPFTVCERFMQTSPYRCPVILVVPAGQRGDAARCRELGVMGYLAQPVAPGDLADTIRAAIGLAESGDRSALVTRHWLREGRRGMHVLIADDNNTNRILMTRVLEERGHLVTAVSNGRQAVEATKNSTFDVVLMDMDMPDMDGLEATQAIRSMEIPHRQRVRIIALTVVGIQEHRDLFIEAGMDGGLLKPILAEELISTVERQAPSGVLASV